MENAKQSLVHLLALSPRRKRRTPYNDKDLEHFRELILAKRDEAVEEIKHLKAQLENNDRDHLDADSAYSYHPADSATDAMERESTYLMIDRQQKLIGYLDRAFERIANKTYGICRVTGYAIDRERLEAIPHTEISVEAKIREQQRGGR
ncbi:MAG: molecular chaperone DnaK [Bacteroidetes bacterium RBG_19FT_COMBO_42_7]|nr:MAG: molecular chaperone DnaK [Bacteroidetes bacterium RBG_19FT_COMBO_42_7]